MRLIDADILYELIDNGWDIDFSEVPETKAALLEMINQQETVDAVLVTRCKECVLSENIENDRTLCRLIDMTVDSNGFCECGQKNVN